MTNIPRFCLIPLVCHNGTWSSQLCRIEGFKMFLIEGKWFNPYEWSFHILNPHWWILNMCHQISQVPRRPLFHQHKKPIGDRDTQKWINDPSFLESNITYQRMNALKDAFYLAVPKLDALPHIPLDFIAFKNSVHSKERLSNFLQEANADFAGSKSLSDLSVNILRNWHNLNTNCTFSQICYLKGKWDNYYSLNNSMTKIDL